jgi:hypothetical protein
MIDIEQEPIHELNIKMFIIHTFKPPLLRVFSTYPAILSPGSPRLQESLPSRSSL